MDTFLSLLLTQSRNNPDRPGMRTKDRGIWKTISWSQTEERTSIYAKGLASKGIGAGAKVGVFGPNSSDMYLVYLAAHSLGAIPVPINANAYGDELRLQLHAADVEHVIAVEQQEVDALLECGQTCVRQIFYFNRRGMETYAQPELVQISTVIADIEPDPGLLEQLEAQRSPDETAAILFTSGSVAAERPVELSHAGVIATARSIAERENITHKDDILAYLPLGVCSDFLFSYAMALQTGCTLNCPESDDTVLQDMQEIGPTVLYGPSYIYKYIFMHASNRIESATTFDTVIYKAALRNVMQVAEKWAAGKSASLLDHLKFMLGRITTFLPFCNVYGLSRLRLAMSGGDALAPAVFRFFRVIGIDLRETYGQVEGCSCITMQSAQDWNSDSVGQPLDGVELRIEDDEIWFRGPGQMKGIYNDPTATADSMRDGWVRTNDAGRLDDQGRLHVHGSLARMGKLNGGEQFMPDLLESHLRSSEYIKQAIVFGSGRDYPVAIVSVDSTITPTWADRRNLRYTGLADLSAHTSVQELVRETLQKMNGKLAADPKMEGMQLRRFAILNREFMASVGEVTATRKLRSQAIEDKHQGLVEALYSDALEYTYTDPLDSRSYTLPLGDV